MFLYLFESKYIFAPNKADKSMYARERERGVRRKSKDYKSLIKNPKHFCLEKLSPLHDTYNFIYFLFNQSSLRLKGKGKGRGNKGARGRGREII